MTRQPCASHFRKYCAPTRILVAALVIGLDILGPTARADAACVVPNQITNGQTADATTVMGNFNALAGCATSVSGATGKIIVSTGPNALVGSDLSGDVSTAGGTVTTLANTAVSPSSYTSANITVDSKGRVTAASNGASGGGGSNEVLISGTTTSGNAPSVTFSAIPATFKELKVRVFGRSSNPGTDYDTLLMQLNGDSGANYTWARTGTSQPGGIFSSGGANVSSATVGYVSGSTSDAAFPGFAEVQIPYYASSVWKKVGWAKGIGRGNTSIYELDLGFSWSSAAPITQIVITLSGANTFIDGSIVELIGVNY